MFQSLQIVFFSGTGGTARVARLFGPVTVLWFLTLAGLGARSNMTLLLVPIMSVSLIGLGFLLERTRPNWFIGIRTPWTLTSPTVWARTHRLA